MRGYLRPSTLFGPKFSEYLNAPEPKQMEDQRDLAYKVSLLMDRKTQLQNEIVALRAITDGAEQNSQVLSFLDQLATKEDQLEKINERLEAMG